MVQESSAGVSVIIPTFNRATHLPRAIDSALGQTLAPDEVLVVDDGSTDDTRSVLEGYGDRIHCLWQENRGAAAARNRGLALARGRWVAFLDSDDAWLPRKLEVQLRALREAGARFGFTAALVGSAGDPAPPPDEGAARTEPGWELCDPALALVLDERRPTYLPTLVAERALVEEAGRFDETLRVAEDTKLAVALAMRAAALYVREPLVRIDRSLARGGLITDDLEAKKLQARGGLQVLEMALEASDGDPALRRVVRRLLARNLATLAGLDCLEGRRAEARGHALDALRQGGDARTRLKSLAAVVAPGLLAGALSRRRSPS